VSGIEPALNVVARQHAMRSVNTDQLIKPHVVQCLLRFNSNMHSHLHLAEAASFRPLAFVLQAALPGKHFFTKPLASEGQS
jgi:hypothetical protein